MKIPPKTMQITLVALLFAGVFGWLAYASYGTGKQYYVTIAELRGMGDKAYHSRMRVEGFVQPGSIQRHGARCAFVLNEFESHTPQAAAGHRLAVNYQGSEPPPDTFQNNAQVLAEGVYSPSGVFQATALQSKCASKYTAAVN